MPHPDMKANNGHPDEGLLHEWLDDQLSPVDAAEMQAHIAGCAACGARVAEARGLIAASHRILSALDEVPSGVIPANFGASHSAQSNVAHADVATTQTKSDANGVVSIDAARKSLRVAESKNTFRWRRAASIAALLLVAVTVVRFGAMGDDVTVPVTSVANRALQTTSSTAAPANGADRVADARAAAPQAEAPRMAAVRESAAPAADGSAQKSRAATTSKPEQVASEISDARASANASAKKVSETFVAGAAVVAAVQATSAVAAPPASVAAAPPLPTAVLATPPLLTADQIAARPDALNGRAAAAVGAGSGGGRGGRAGGRSAAEPPPMVANAATTGTVSNAAPIGAATASALPVSAPLATPPAPAVRDSNARRVELETAPRMLAQAQVQRRTNLADTTAPRSTLQLRGLGANAGAAASTATAFDSVTLERTQCSPACESTSLHVNALGAVRYVVGGGNTQRVVMSQLSVVERAQLQTLLMQSFPSPVLQRGRTICASPAATSERKDFRDTGPEVQFLLDMPGSSTLQPEQRCTKSVTELRDIGARVDAIAGTDALKRRVPLRD